MPNDANPIRHPTLPRSAVADICWPAIPSPRAGALLGLIHQLEQTQWWPREALRAAQLRQASILVAHAYQQCPFYRERLASSGYRPGTELDEAGYASLPIVTRADIQAAGENVFARHVPRAHGRVMEGKTTGSTGRPLVFRGTWLAIHLWHALTLREHLWHRRDLGMTLAIIRTGSATAQRRGWGGAAELVFATGRSTSLDIRTDVAHQLEWLREQQPAYFLTHPSNLRALAQHCRQSGAVLDTLREVRTVGEIVDDSLREVCQKAFGVPLTDIYSATETGYIALQCPETPHYHEQSEAVLLEVLNDAGKPCAPGEMGRVVLTVLHNFAMPMIRYEIGDFAVAGAPCNCGRGLPVIERIVGRERNLVVLPDGRRYWPQVGYKQWAGVVPIEQSQFVQKNPHTIEARLVTARELTADETSMFITAFRDAIGYPFHVEITYHRELARGPGGKFEEFVSLINPERQDRPG